MKDKKRRSSDNYVQLRRTITNRDAIKLLTTLSRERFMSPQEICYTFIFDALAAEAKKRYTNDVRKDYNSNFGR